MLLHLIFLQVLSMIIGAMTILILQKAYKRKRLNHKKLYAKLAYRLDQMKKESQRLSAVRHLVNERLDTVNCFIAAEMSHRHDYAAAMLDKLTRDSNYFMESTKASFEIAHPEFLDFLKDGEKEVSELDAMANAQGITKRTLTRAKTELKKDGKIRYRNSGSGRSSDKKFYISLIASE